MNKKQIAITLGIVCLILTMFVVIQIRTTNNANKVVSQTFTSNDLRNQVLKWKERYDITYAELQSSEKKLEDVRQQASENTDGSDEKEAKLKKNNIFIFNKPITLEKILNRFLYNGLDNKSIIEFNNIVTNFGKYFFIYKKIFLFGSNLFRIGLCRVQFQQFICIGRR